MVTKEQSSEEQIRSNLDKFRERIRRPAPLDLTYSAVESGKTVIRPRQCSRLYTR
ncbi:hypothetical protein GCM10027299_25460 [Larkinella ripae]